MPLSPEQAAQAVALVEDGRSMRYVAEVLSTTPSTISRTVQRYRETGSFARRPGTGPRRATSERDDRFLQLQVLRDRHTTAIEARNRLHQVRGVNVSERTVRRRLEEANLQSRRPATGPELTREHRTARLRFAREHHDWTEQQWERVLFTDESRFGVRSPDGRERVWRRPGERYSPCTFSSRTPFQGGSVMVWAGINMAARTELVFVEHGSLTAHRYVEEILLEHVVPFAPFIGDDFTLMHDNARPHVARIVREFLDEVEIHAMAWPARSPDLNPIEHVWDRLGRRARQRNPETLQDLRNVLLEEWEMIPQQDIAALIRSMPERLNAVIGARGGNTRF